MVEHTCNSNPFEAEAEDQPRLYSEIRSQKKTNNRMIEEKEEKEKEEGEQRKIKEGREVNK